MGSVELSDEPSPELCKEVYARYGLCVAASQLLETHLINMLTVYETARDPVPTQATFDRLYAANEKLTFGNLIKAFDKHDYLSHFKPIVLSLKANRDFLAHRIFRERAGSFVTSRGCHQLIEDLDRILKLFDETIASLQAIETEVTRKIGYHSSEFEDLCNRLLDEMIEDAKRQIHT